MESSALVCGEYSSGDENDPKRKGGQSDVNYDEVGMDMGSSCSSEQEDEGNQDKPNPDDDDKPVAVNLFSSKEEYEAYESQFGSKSEHKNESKAKFEDSPNNSHHKRERNEALHWKDASEYGETFDKDEYGGCQPSSSRKSKTTASRETVSTAREPHRRANHSQNYESNIHESNEETERQPTKRSLSSDEKLKDKLLSMSQEEPSSSGSERGDTRKQHTTTRSRSRSRDRARTSRSPSTTSRKRSRSRSRSQERRREHDRHRSSHHRSSKHHHHHRDHRDHRDRDRHNGRHRDRHYKGNDHRRNRDRVSEEQRQELRNKKLVNLGITSDAVLAAATQRGGFDVGNSDAVAMRAQQMISRQLEAQVAKAKEVTGVELPSYYNPSVINPLKYADQIKKRKLLWGSSGGGTGIRQPENANVDTANQSTNDKLPTQNKSHEDSMLARKSLFESSTKKPDTKESFNNWESTNFGDDKANDKFRRLMGIKSTVPNSSEANKKHPSAVPATGDKSTKFFQEQEAQYERARAITHTQRGMGFGFGDAAQPQPEHSMHSNVIHGNSSEQSDMTSNTHKNIGERLGFIKKSL